MEVNSIVRENEIRRRSRVWSVPSAPNQTQNKNPNRYVGNARPGNERRGICER